MGIVRSGSSASAPLGERWRAKTCPSRRDPYDLVGGGLGGGWGLRGVDGWSTPAFRDRSVTRPVERSGVHARRQIGGRCVARLALALRALVTLRAGRPPVLPSCGADLAGTGGAGSRSASAA